MNEDHDSRSLDTELLPDTLLAETHDFHGGPGLQLPPTILPEAPGFRFISFIGRGGMGVVWLADQLATHRKVAVKFIRGGAAWGGDPMSRARFEREIELAARLDHPNIARVFSGGEHEGDPYCVMEFIEGDAVTEHVVTNRLPRREILGIMRKICEAVDHAHRRGVIHRDLKPSNILVTVPAEPKLLDFGMARALEAQDSRLTLEGALAGTPAYMSPEQARGETGLIDTRSDIYSLGVVFYELLTKRLPYPVEGSTERILDTVSRSVITRPRNHDRSIPPDLEMCLLRALAPLPGDRYASAGEMADDIGRYLNGEPLVAGRTSTIYFLRKWVSRNRVAFAAGSALLATGTTALAYHWRTLDRERDSAVAAEGRAAASLHDFLSSAITEHMQRGEHAKALALIDEATRIGHPAKDELFFQRIEALEAIGDPAFITLIKGLDRDRIQPSQRPRVDYWKAERMLQDGDLKQGQALMRKAVAGGLPPVEHALARAALSDTLEEAVSHYTEATARDPWRSLAQRNLVLALLFSGKIDAARSRIHLCRHLFPKDGNFPGIEALLEAFQGNPDQAFAIAESIPENYRQTKTYVRRVVRPMAAFSRDLVGAMCGAPPRMGLKDQMILLAAVAETKLTSLGRFSAPGLSGTPDLLTRGLSGFAAALGTYAMGNHAKAATQLRDTLKVCDEGTLWALVGLIEQQRGRYPEALFALREAQSTPALFGGVSDAARMAEGATEAFIWLKSRDPASLERANAAFRDAYKSGLPLEGAHEMVIGTALAGGDLFLALLVAKSMPHDGPARPAALTRIAYADGNRTKALKLAEDAVLRFPDDRKCAELLVRIRDGTLNVPQPGSP